LGALDNLADSVNQAVLNSNGVDAGELPNQLNLAFSEWIKTAALPLLTGAAIFVTVLFVFYGAFLYFTAYGDENKATQAKKTLTYAIIGFSIAVMSLAIINYVKKSLITKDYESTKEGTTTGPAAGTNPDFGAPTQGGDVDATDIYPQGQLNVQ